MAHGGGLAFGTAASNIDLCVEFAGRARDGQRLRSRGALGFERKIIFKRATIDRDLATASRETDAGDGGLATTSAEVFGRFCFSYLSEES